MASGLSKTAIFNMVLDRLTEEVVLSPSDERSVARWLSRNYDVQRDVLLELHPWNFAIARAALAADSDTPAFEWTYQYTLPADCLRLLPITTDGKKDSPQVNFVIEGTKILCNKTAPLYVRYIKRATNEALFTNTFAHVLALRLSALAAFPITGKTGFAEKLANMVPIETANAQLLDSLEGVPDEPDDFEIIDVR